MTVAITNWSDLDDSERSRLLRRPAVTQDAEIRSGVAEIIAAVRDRGDSAVRDLTQQYDRASVADFQVSAEEIAAATERLTPDQLAAIDLAIDNVRRFHEPQRPLPIVVETMPGVICERFSHPIEAVGLYVPAGTAPLPSAAIMLAVPASIAGCRTKVLCTPPRKDGTADPAVLVAATRAGVTDIFKIGGAQAIAAMAYGTQSVPKVNKVFGPGNAWVTAAKSQVSGDPAGAAIDSPRALQRFWLSQMRRLRPNSSRQTCYRRQNTASIRKPFCCPRAGNWHPGWLTSSISNSPDFRGPG